jgi:hypothetical protein
MKTLKFLGREDPRDWIDPAAAVADIAGIGRVAVGGTFEVSDDRAAELLAKQTLCFEVVGAAPEPERPKKGKAS